VNSKLTATDHVSYLLDSCSSLLHALRVLRTHGLPSQSLKDVFHATVIGKLTYCASAWHKFCLASDYTRLNSFLRRAVKLGYTTNSLQLLLICSTMQMMRSFVSYCTTKNTFFTRTCLSDLILYILCVLYGLEACPMKNVT